jgi:hypothetical protein
MMKKNLLAAGLLAVSAMAVAAAPATVTTDLNLRRGPGTSHAVIGILRAGATVEIGDCNGAWCSVAFGGLRGYASLVYLAPAMAGPGGPSLLGVGAIPRLNLPAMGTTIGSMLGLDLGFLAPPSSSGGGYYPPNRRLFPAYGEDPRQRYDADPAPQYVEPWHAAVRPVAPPPATRQGLNRAAENPDPEIYGSPAYMPVMAQPDVRTPARSESAAATGGSSADLKR